MVHFNGRTIESVVCNYDTQSGSSTVLGTTLSIKNLKPSGLRLSIMFIDDQYYVIDTNKLHFGK